MMIIRNNENKNMRPQYQVCC